MEQILNEEPDMIPHMKLIAGALTVITTVVTTALAVDYRYAHASDVQRAQSRIELRIEQNGLQQRRAYVEDKVFELELKPESLRSETDKARLNRHQRDLEAIDRSLNAVERQLRR